MPACTNDDAILKDFTRVVEQGANIHIECARISWPTPSQPHTRWVLARTLRGPRARWEEADIESIRRALLTKTRFFRVCQRCELRQPCGWMLDGTTCQACAERYLDVVH